MIYGTVEVAYGVKIKVVIVIEKKSGYEEIPNIVAMMCGDSSRKIALKLTLTNTVNLKHALIHLVMLDTVSVNIILSLKTTEEDSLPSTL